MLENLLKITKKEIGGALVNTVDDRELWEKLEAKTQFPHWIARRLKSTPFIGAEDFVSFERQRTGGRPARGYTLSVEMAKHLALMENTPKGYEIRGYFIECEGSLKETLSVFESEDPLCLTTLEEILEHVIKIVRLLTTDTQKGHLNMI